MKIVLASHNKGKLEEFRHLFSKTNYEMLSLADYSQEEADETGLTFVENAIIKARYGCEKTGLPCIADDSGLVVPVLNGAPGIYSARYAGEHGNGSKNIEKLLYEMRDFPDQKRNAYFQCVLVFMQHAADPSPIIAEGRLHGIITRQKMGEQGFGYDPVMFLPEKNGTVAELSFEEKNQISHRSLAMRRMIESIESINNIY